MSIHKIGSDIIRPFERKGTNPADRKTDDGGNKGPSRTPRADEVGFSAEGLALAEQSLRLDEGVFAERLAQIQSRIAEGFYDSPEVAEEVAHRLLDSGDLDHLV